MRFDFTTNETEMHNFAEEPATPITPNNENFNFN